MYEVRFWNAFNENIKVGGKYSHAFETKQDAWESALAMIKTAYNNGAVEVDINNEFYPIVNE